MSQYSSGTINGAFFLISSGGHFGSSKDKSVEYPPQAVQEDEVPKHPHTEHKYRIQHFLLLFKDRLPSTVEPMPEIACGYALLFPSPSHQCRIVMIMNHHTKEGDAVIATFLDGQVVRGVYKGEQFRNLLKIQLPNGMLQHLRLAELKSLVKV